MNLEDLPDKPLERLAAYRKGMEEEARRVANALRTPPRERTEQEQTIIAYSGFGTGSGCSCGGC